LDDLLRFISQGEVDAADTVDRHLWWHKAFKAGFVGQLYGWRLAFEENAGDHHDDKEY
jgi:hypothetical protein